MRVTVTGGAGFIGANLCRVLGAAGDDVTVLDDLSTGNKQNLAGTGASFVQGSILDAETLDRVFAASDAVVHLAARPSVPKSLADPSASHHINSTGTVQVLEAVRRARNEPHLVVASSSSVYGGNPHLPKAEHLRPMPLSPYAATKLATESYALAWASSFGLRVLAFRFFNVFGPLQPAGHAYAAVVPAFVSAAISGRPLPLHGDGHQTRDFTYVETVAEVIAKAVRDGVSSPDPVNLAFGSRSSLLEVIGLLEDILQRDLPIEHLPPRVGDVRDSQADQTRLRELFPDVVPVDLRTGLSRTVDWFRGMPHAP